MRSKISIENYREIVLLHILIRDGYFSLPQIDYAECYKTVE